MREIGRERERERGREREREREKERMVDMRENIIGWRGECGPRTNTGR